MPRPRKPARLYLRPDDSAWIIRDGGSDTRTGLFGARARADAEAALGRYLTERGIAPVREISDQTPVMVLVNDYAIAKESEIADPERMDYAIPALARFWTGKTVAQVHQINCKEYLKHRKRSRSTVRRELTVLRAALNHARAHLDKMPEIWLPAETPPRQDWHTRDEFAAMLYQLWKHKRTRHAARLALCQFYTGSRSGTVAQTTWERRTDGPWIDLDQGIWWRRGEDEQRTNKGREKHRIPPGLLAHLRRWKRSYSGVFIVEHRRRPGWPVRDIGKALTTACDKAGVRRLTPHGIKHTAITLFIQSGGSIEQACEYFSTSPETIRKTYWHHSPHHQTAIVSLVQSMGKRQRV